MPTTSCTTGYRRQQQPHLTTSQHPVRHHPSFVSLSDSHLLRRHSCTQHPSRTCHPHSKNPGTPAPIQTRPASSHRRLAVSPSTLPLTSTPQVRTAHAPSTRTRAIPRLRAYGRACGVIPEVRVGADAYFNCTSTPQGRRPACGVQAFRSWVGARGDGSGVERVPMPMPMPRCLGGVWAAFMRGVGR